MMMGVVLRNDETIYHPLPELAILSQSRVNGSLVHSLLEGA